MSNTPPHRTYAFSLAFAAALGGFLFATTRDHRGAQLYLKEQFKLVEGGFLGSRFIWIRHFERPFGLPYWFRSCWGAGCWTAGTQKALNDPGSCFPGAIWTAYPKDI